MRIDKYQLISKKGWMVLETKLQDAPDWGTTYGIAWMRVLLIEDDSRVALPIQAELEYQRYVVDTAVDGREGLLRSEQTNYDLILLDLLLPKLDGVAVCTELRRRGYSGPILMMTARSTTQDKVMGLDAGADDYLVKPFDLEELSARVRALLRRGVPERTPILSWGDVKVDPAKCTVYFKDNLVGMTPTEYRLLVFFLRNSEQTFSADALVQRLWISEENPTRDVIKAHLKGLRRKLRDAGLRVDIVETVYGFGYRLKPYR